MSGFLGSKEQIQIVLRFFREFKTEENIIVVDPVMGDYGKTYSTYTPQMCSEMKKLAAYADILTPNLTEACILTDTPYHEEKWRMKEITALAEKLSAMGPEKIVITGIIQGDFIANYCYEKGKPADAVNKVPFGDSVRKASLFIKKCIERSTEMELPLTDGVCFEEFLGSLK